MDQYSAFRKSQFSAFRSKPPTTSASADTGLILPDRPNAIFNPQDGESHWWYHPSTYGGMTLAGEPVNGDNLLQAATCYACTKAIAETFAGLPTEVYRWSTTVRELQRDSDPYFLLVESPNEEMDPFLFHELVATRVINRGNFFAEKERDAQDRVVGLWPIHPSRVKPLRDSNNKLFWEITHDYDGDPEYADPSWRREYLSYISGRDMMNIVGFGSYNGIIGNGMIMQAEEIGIEMAALRYGADFYSNGTVPAGFVEHPSFITDKEKRREYREDINRIHNRERNKIGVLWEGSKYVAISMDPAKAQLIEARKYSRRTICSLYGTPPQIIGDMEDSKYATADAAIRHWVLTTIRNLCRRIESAYESQLLYRRDMRYGKPRMVSQFDQNYVFEFILRSLLQGDPETHAKSLQMHRMSGALSTDEYRQEIGYDPIGGDEGNMRIVTGGSTRLSMIDNQGSRQSSPSQTSNNDNNNQSSDQQAANVPTFCREQLASMILESGLARGDRPSAQVQGWSASTAAKQDAAKSDAAKSDDAQSPTAPAADSQADAAKEQQAKEQAEATEREIARLTLQTTLMDLTKQQIRQIHAITINQVKRWETQDPAKVAADMPKFFAKQQQRLAEALAPTRAMAEQLGRPGDFAESISKQFVGNFAAMDHYDIFDRERLNAIAHDYLQELESCF